MAGKRKLAHPPNHGNAKNAQANVSGGNAAKKRKHTPQPPAASKTAKTAKAAPKVVMNVAASANSNWLALKATIQQADKPKAKKHDLDVRAHKQKVKDAKTQQRKQQRTAEWIDNARIVAMDCEMVGVGLSGKTSVLARCSLVDYDGNVLYDKHVRPVEKVTDFRTHVSGIRSRSLKHAIPFAQCLKEVGKLLHDKIVVGHALKNDFHALMFTPPKPLIRDTARYRPYMRRKMTGTKLYPKSLKHLADEVLGRSIQGGEHDSVEDARAALELYKREQFVWEKYLRTAKNPSALAGVAPPLPALRTDDKKPAMSAALKDALDLESDADDGVSDTEATASSSNAMTAPDASELALMEYGE